MLETFKYILKQLDNSPLFSMSDCLPHRLSACENRRACCLIVKYRLADYYKHYRSLVAKGDNFQIQKNVENFCFAMFCFCLFLNNMFSNYLVYTKTITCRQLTLVVSELWWTQQCLIDCLLINCYTDTEVLYILYCRDATELGSGQNSDFF